MGVWMWFGVAVGLGFLLLALEDAPQWLEERLDERRERRMAAEIDPRPHNEVKCALCESIWCRTCGETHICPLQNGERPENGD